MAAKLIPKVRHATDLVKIVMINSEEIGSNLWVEEMIHGRLHYYSQPFGI